MLKIGKTGDQGGNPRGKILVDNDEYDVYVIDKFNQPSIDGNTNFKQYWSVRTRKRRRGTVTVNHHFLNWFLLGLSVGKVYDTSLNIEGYQSFGSATVNKNEIIQKLY